jgi:arylsulfatase
LIAASATLALNAGVWSRRGLLDMISPDSRAHFARRQAETPLVVLFKNPEPLLFAKLAGAPVPQDRAIDGVDQTDFLLGKKETSNREGILLFLADRLQAVKWRNWKLHLYDEMHNWFTPPLKLGTPKLFNLILDPKEEFPVTVENTWAVEPMTKMIAAFELSAQKYPLIAPGTPDPYVAPKSN